MKDFKSIAVLLLLFLCAQLFGLFVIESYMSTGEYFIEPQKVQNESLSWIPILTLVFGATALIFFLIKFKLFRVWKLWFSASIFIAVFLSVFPFFRLFSVIIAGLAVFFKLRANNLFMVNVVEILMYGGIATLIVPMLNMYSATILLIGISVYDAFAVWRSKHMIRLADSQRETNTFAGIRVGKDMTKSGAEVSKTATHSNSNHKHVSSRKTLSRSSGAMLGGGDIAFTLFFAGAVMQAFNSFIYGIVIIIWAFVGLSGLLLFAKKGVMYPAMPYITTGCFIGLLFCFL